MLILEATTFLIASLPLPIIFLGSITSGFSCKYFLTSKLQDSWISELILILVIPDSTHFFKVSLDKPDPPWRTKGTSNSSAKLLINL